jgi:hypothetical protein
MAKLELTEAEVEDLCGALDIEIEAWEEELERICLQPFDTWEQLLDSSALSGRMVENLTRIRKQLQDE